MKIQKQIFKHSKIHSIFGAPKSRAFLGSKKHGGF